MKPEHLTEALEAAAAQLGVKVRYETMTGETAGAAGLCRIRGDWQVIVDRKTTASERASVLAEALSGFDIEKLYLPPEVRRAIESRCKPDATA